MVCSISGGQIKPHVLLVIGLANLFADAFSMALGDFLSSKAELESETALHQKHVKLVELDCESQKRLLVDSYTKKGFSERDANTLVNILCKNKEMMVQALITVETDSSEKVNSPTVGAMWTFASFVCFGIIPLCTYMIAPIWFSFGNERSQFWLTVLLTGGTLWALGAMKVFEIVVMFCQLSKIFFIVGSIHLHEISFIRSKCGGI